MPRLIFISFFVSLIFSCGSIKLSKEHKQQHQYIPKDFHNTYLGMSLEDFKNKKPNAKFYSESDFRKIYSEEISGGDIKTVSYYFGTKDNLPLYEYIFDYHSKDKRDAFIESNLGAPNDGDQWRFSTKEGFDILAWTYKNKLIVTGLIVNTEWYDEENNN